MTISRRSIVAGAAWAVPAALVGATATAAPARAAAARIYQPTISYFSTPTETFVTVAFSDSQLVEAQYVLTVTHVSGSGESSLPAPKTFHVGYEPQLIFSVRKVGTYTAHFTVTAGGATVYGPSAFAFYHPGF